PSCTTSAGSRTASAPPTATAWCAPSSPPAPSAAASTTGTRPPPTCGRIWPRCAAESLEESPRVAQGELGQGALGDQVGGLVAPDALDGEAAPLARGPTDDVGGVGRPEGA